MTLTPELLDELERLRAMLRRLQWTSEVLDKDTVTPTCPICGREEDEGKHDDDCALAALLENKETP